jgi:uncharacterized protein (DUF1015 family)
MAIVSPFRALRPRPSAAASIAAVPYDVVHTEEARALADGQPLSFLRVSRAEIELPAGTPPYSDAVYSKATDNFAALRESALVLEDEPSLYLYRLQIGGHVQLGLAGCFSLDEYERGAIKRHEITRKDKEDDRTRHLVALGAQTGPVLLTYRARPELDRLAEGAASGEPLFDFEAADAVRHTIWRIAADRDRFVEAFAQVPALYIADGHHRAASAARARQQLAGRVATSGPASEAADPNTVLAVAFPHDQMQILPYNRVVRDLAGASTLEFLERVRERFSQTPGSPTPRNRGDIAMYLEREWRTIRPLNPPAAADLISALDVSILQDQLLGPVLHIGDIRTDQRIDFVGGARGTEELARIVDSGRAAVAFSMYPVSVADLMAVSDSGAIMPPKSTWFEPKLRDGLLIHLV